MSSAPLDSSGQAREALATAVSNFGPRILSNPQMLENVFRDLLPDAPREVSILVTAAQAEVPSLLQDRIGQHMDPDTATRLTASVLGEQRALDGAACLWATTEFARALGYAVSDVPAAGPTGTQPDAGGSGWTAAAPSAAAPPGGFAPPWPGSPAGTGAPPGSGAPAGTGTPPWAGAQAGTGTGAPPWAGAQAGAGTGTSPPGPAMPQGAGIGEDDRTRTQGTGGFAAGGVAAGGFAAGGAGGVSPPHSPPPRGGRNRLVAAVVAAVLVVGAVVGFLVTRGPAKSTVQTTTTTTPSNPTTTLPRITTTTTPNTTTPPSLTSLTQLVPGDDQDPTTCSPFQLVNTQAQQAQVVSSLRCEDTDVNAFVFAIQFQTLLDYEEELTTFNATANYDLATASPACPPESGTQGGTSYSFSSFPARSGQFLECFSDNQGFTYVWTLPSENAFLWTTTTQPSDVENWWSQGSADPSF